MKNILDEDYAAALRAIIIQDLKELGIKVPKAKKNKKEDFVDAEFADQSVFGNSLQNSSSIYVDNCGYVPRFLVDATKLIEDQIQVEGIFRKAGSIARQKELKQKLENGCEIKDAQVIDIAALIKQFFRELPDSVLSSSLHDTFLKCAALEGAEQQQEAAQLLCLLLPASYLSTLRFILLFLAKVAAESQHNRMDAYNLAVCLAPSFMWVVRKGEKVKDNSKDIDEKHMQKVSIIQTLIRCAQGVGVVTPSLQDRASLMASFPGSEDELEKSDVHDSSKTKKKKRRSGSLQGLINSFSKWRKDKSHNSSSLSERSTLSITSTVSGDSGTSQEYVLPDVVVSHPPEATPKVIRKRKASVEMLPFSASKKKAILSQMPQMSALGSTPFTPASAVRARGKGANFALDSPSINFTDDSQVEFTATPGYGSARKIEKPLFSSLTKSKRHNTTKQGCFSPKTNKKRGVKGFLRRLSGSRDPSPCGKRESPDAAFRLAGTSLNMSESLRRKKRSSLFRRHKRTPSSPARLITPPLSEEELIHLSKTTKGLENYSVTVANPSELSATVDMSVAGLIDGEPSQGTSSPVCGDTEDGGIEELSKMDCSDKQHSRANSSFGVSPLKRGKPNRVNNGLPPQRYVPSPDRSRRSMDAHFPREECVSPEALSPQSYVSPQRRSSCQVGANGVEVNGAGEHVPQNEDANNQFSTTIIYSHPSEETSANPVDSSAISADLSLEAGPDDNMDMSVHDDSLDHAFIGDEESPNTTVCSAESSKGTDNLQVVSKHNSAGEIKKPTNITVESNAGRFNNPDINDTNMNSSVERAASNSSVCTVVHTGKQESETGQVDSVTSNKMQADLGMKKYTSCQMRQAHRSLKEANVNRRRSMDPESLKTQLFKQPNSTESRQKAEDTSGSDSPLLAYLKNPRKPLRPSPEGKEMQDTMENTSQNDESFPLKPFIKGAEVRLPSHASVIDLKHKHAGKVAASVEQFDKESDAKDLKEVQARHEEPLRFPNSTLRRGSPVRIPTIFAKKEHDANKFREMAQAAIRSSPKPNRGKANIPITSNLVKSTSVEQAISRLSNSANESSLMLDESILSNNCNINDSLTMRTPQVLRKLDGPGHTPLRVKGPILATVELDSTLQAEDTPGVGRTPLKDSNQVTKTVTGRPPSITTPRIKAPIIPTDSISKRLLQHQFTETPGRNPGVKKICARSPVKPVKRLNSPCSSHSPRKGPHRSPIKHQRGLSPIAYTGIETTF